MDFYDNIVKPFLYIVSCLIGLMGLYVVVRVLSTAIFKSYFEAKMGNLKNTRKEKQNEPKV